MEEASEGKAEPVWTTYNIRLAPGRYTMGSPKIGAAELMAARLVQLATDFLPRSLEGARVLDLGCQEGLYGLEFAMHGANVVALEGREGNAMLARLAAKELGVDDRYEVRVEDVRELSPERHGTFDVVLCLGILYHLDAADAFQLAKSVYATCDRLAIIRTAVGLTGKRAERDGERVYHGFTYTETQGRWASIGNSTSFWMTRASLLNLLCDVGFTSIVDAAAPPILELDQLEDLATLVCVNGAPSAVLATPEGTDALFHAERWPEGVAAIPSPMQRRRRFARRSIRRFWGGTTNRT